MIICDDRLVVEQQHTSAGPDPVKSIALDHYCHLAKGFSGVIFLCGCSTPQIHGEFFFPFSFFSRYSFPTRGP